uniref:PABS domain-containing protein n=1 Tax=Odontella aurita TaxID=265563 RepID=A0A7S4MHK2_9STRA|mmetsp:Transcript_21637/g.63534  ORF Transcript_21637/g.63534 Transcript_21637/m.63534 type:complete len:864 (+) Transcript_21637:205-2796(+)
MVDQDGASPPRRTDGTRRYAIDVRIFLAVITTAMACSFFAGVAFGPTPAELGVAQQQQLQQQQLQQQQQQQPEVPPAASSGGAAQSPAASERKPVPDAIQERRTEAVVGEDGEIIRQPRRLPTAHSAELGPRVRESHVNFEDPTYEDFGEGAVVRSKQVNLTGGKEGEDDEDEEEHLPQGQHLLVDIKNVEHDFLNSEDRLAEAMVDVVNAGGLTLLSYHCHSLQPKGVSCVGVLLESHVSFHTWPDEGVITLDLFTCGSSPLLPVVPQVEKLFGIPRAKLNEDGKPTGEKEDIVTLWSHELRGFRHPEGRKNDYLDDQSDLSYWIVSPLDMAYKKQIVSTASKYQRIDIWDTLDADDTPSYQDAVDAGLEPGDPRWLTNEVAKPERLLFLDGTLQSLSDSEHEYHEALVHPAMFAHPDPKRVAIVGGGEGATLREVLKHKTVEDAVMIEIDEELVDIAKEHLPFMSNCSTLEGAPESGSCFDDPRADLIFADGKHWFVDRFAREEDAARNDKFDVIVLDALDPEDDTDVSEGLYTDESFLTSLFNALTPEGVVVVQVGTAPNIHDPRPDLGVYATREKMFNVLESHPGTAAMLVYEEAHCGFNEPHSFLVVCKSPKCRARWYAESDAIDFWVYDRVNPTNDGEISLLHYDGSTQRSYQVPPRAWETVYCRREPMPFECDYRFLDPEIEMFDFASVYEDEDEDEESDFEVKSRTDEDGEEYTSVYALVDIPKGSYIAPYDLAGSFLVRDESVDNLRKNTEIAGTGQIVIIEDMINFVDYHGHKSMAEGSGVNYVEVGGTFMMRRTEDVDETNVGRWMPPNPSGKIPVYSPVYERHMMSFDLFLVATKDIKKGEEVVKHEKLWD